MVRIGRIAGAVGAVVAVIFVLSGMCLAYSAHSASAMAVHGHGYSGGSGYGHGIVGDAVVFEDFDDIDVNATLEKARDTLNESEVFWFTNIWGRKTGIIVCNDTAIGRIWDGVELNEVDVGPIVIRPRFGDFVKVLLTKDEVVVGWIFVSTQ